MKSWIYIVGNWSGTVLYVGVTTYLKKRIKQHKDKAFEGFTKKYEANRLLYFETFNYVGWAIDREKQLKSWSRRKKVLLINQQNPTWRDLYDSI